MTRLVDIRRRVALFIAPELAAMTIPQAPAVPKISGAVAVLTLAETYAAHAGVTHWAVSMRIFGKGDFFAKLMKGADCRTRTEDRVLSWFAGHWPADLEWPDGIERPSNRQGDPA